jgi:hypothetical protein
VHGPCRNGCTISAHVRRQGTSNGRSVRGNDKVQSTGLQRLRIPFGLRAEIPSGIAATGKQQKDKPYRSIAITHPEHIRPAISSVQTRHDLVQLYQPELWAISRSTSPNTFHTCDRCGGSPETHVELHGRHVNLTTTLPVAACLRRWRCLIITSAGRDFCAWRAIGFPWFVVCP